jgi:DNA polymerase (family 10)
VTAPEVAAVLDQIAVMLELTGETGFKVLAYRRAADTVRNLEEALGPRVEAATLTDLEGIGEALAAKIETLYRDGQVDLYERLKAQVPAGLLEMLSVPGLGPGKVRRLNAELHITTLDELETACRDGRVGQLRGFGAKSVERLMRGVDWHRKRRTAP